MVLPEPSQDDQGCNVRIFGRITVKSSAITQLEQPRIHANYNSRLSVTTSVESTDMLDIDVRLVSRT
jgi:hypothetical protein